MTRIAIVLVQSFADWECAHLMSAARAYFGLDVVVTTPGGTQVRSSGGLLVTPDADTFALDPASCDAIIVCGSEVWGTDAAPDLGAVLQRFAEAGRVIGGICAGATVVAGAGLLDAIPHTGNNRDELAPVKGYAGPAHYVDTPRAVRSDRVVTAAGIAPVTFMVEVFNALGYGGDELEAYRGMLAAEHQAAA